MTAARRPDFPNFRDYCEAACIKLWGNPSNRDRRELRWNGSDAYSAKTFSFKKKAWYDHGEGWGGSTLDLVAHSKGQPKQDLRGPAFFDAWREAHHEGFVPDPPPEPGKGNGGRWPILDTYPYTDENGVLLYQVVRHDTPNPDDRFRQRRPDGNGGWIWDTKGVRTNILYRLPALIEAVKTGQRILVTEGERDSNTAVALGYASTTMPGGIGKWRSEYDESFRGADVVVVSDNDPQAKDPKTGSPQVHPNGAPIMPGQEHAANVARHMRKVAAHVRVITPTRHKDLTAWRGGGGTRAALDALIDSMPDLIEAPLDAPADTDDGAGFEDRVGLQFAAQHEEDYRYVAQTGKWMIWCKTRWQVDNTLKAFDAARALCRDAGDADAKIVAAVEKLARSDRHLAATMEQWDADPWLLATPGGTVNLKTGEMRPARREDYCTKQTCVAPAPRIEDGGPPPDLWLTFLDTVFNKNGDLIAFVQRLLGYCLTGDISEHILAFLSGTGRNGKGVFCRTAINILGDYANTSPIEMFLESKQDRHPTELARLHKVRLTVAQETPKGRAWDEAKIKNMTGGDPLPARFMRQDFFDFWPTHKLIIAGNHKPKLRMVDEAIRARLRLVPFTVTIPKEERDPKFTEKLKPEYPAILRWMMDGWIDWQENGLGDPDAVREASNDYFHSQDSVAHWIDDRTERRTLAFTLTADLFADWDSWCAERDIDEVGTKTAFTKALQDRGVTYKKGEKGGGFKELVLKLKPTARVNEPSESVPEAPEIEF
jgi:putative DNA primase/helicase